MKGDALKIGIIILAAGSSSRMGQSKQLLDIHGEPLLRRVVRVALEVDPDDVIVVLGANSEEHLKVIKDLPAKSIYNSNWQRGMGSSIKVGLKHLLEISLTTNAVMILVCDQPLLTADHLKELMQRFTTLTPIVAMSYSNTVGVPAIFEKSLFTDLLNLPDDRGAKIVIEKNTSGLLTVPFPEGSMDLDTLADYHRFNDQSTSKNSTQS
jgi:molybdenum cofactor cytidylyltransferase